MLMIQLYHHNIDRATPFPRLPSPYFLAFHVSLRRLLLRASRSAWLARQLSQRAFFRRATRRFMPGEDIGAALAAAADLAREGLGSVLTQLGEQVTSREEAAGVRDHYLRVLEEIRQRQLPAEISVKLTHLGLDLNPRACLQDLLALAARAAAVGSFLWIDMEESRYVDPTLELFQAVRAAHTSVGVCLQAYLRRTPADLEALLPLAPAIRLVKGAYNEPPDVALPKKRDVDAGLCGARRAAARARRPKRGARRARHPRSRPARPAARPGAGRRAAPGAYEVHMLYGIRAAEQRVLHSEGVPVRVLVSYGTRWFPWYMRRLASDRRMCGLW